MSLSCLCPHCGVEIAFGSEYTGSQFTCQCGNEIELIPRIVVGPIPQKPKPVAPPAIQYQQPIPIPEPRQTAAQPSISTVWGWTWRVIVCLLIASFLISLLWGYLYAVTR